MAQITNGNQLITESQLFTDEQTIEIDNWFEDFDSQWEEYDPANSSLLSDYRKKIKSLDETKKLDATKDEQKLYFQTDFLGRWRSAIQIEVLPLHHLIPANNLTATKLPENIKLAEESYVERMRRYLQSLLIGGSLASEIVLLDETLHFQFSNHDDRGNFIETDWEVLHFNVLEGCAEMYLAEMFIIKRRIYEAGKDMKSVIEITNEDLSPYLKEKTFKMLFDGDLVDLFVDSLSAKFSLSINGIGSGNETSDSKRRTKKAKKTLVLPDKFNSYQIKTTGRVKDYLGTSKSKGKSKDGEKTVLKTIRITLSEYWLDWLQTAQIADFNFNLLETITDVRAIRFYELTKFLRVTSDANSGNKLQDKFEISYDRFASLMPLPKLRLESEINHQIKSLVKPLKEKGYLKSFSINDYWRGVGSNSIKITFRFND